MKWIIISSQNQDAKIVANFLMSYNVDVDVVDPKIVSKASAFDKSLIVFQNACKSVRSATHCIFLETYSPQTTNFLTYVLGFMEGVSSQCFCVGDIDDNPLSVYFHYPLNFSDVDTLLSFLRNNFKDFVLAESQKIAHKILFDSGIPFTTDCFAFYVTQNDVKHCELFVAAGMDVNARNSEGTPMICMAARYEQKDVIRWLISCGADIDAVSEDRGYSAVMDAVWKNNIELVKLFVDLGANLNLISRDGQSVLVLAVGTENVRMCELLVRNGANPLIKDKMGMSALDYAKLFRKDVLIPLFEECIEKEYWK